MTKNEDSMHNDTSNDPALLLVKGSFDTKEDNSAYVKQLGSVVATVFNKHGVVRLRCIGKKSITNGVYAHAQANLLLSKQGVTLVGIPTYKTISISGPNGDSDVVSLVMELRKLVSSPTE